MAVPGILGEMTGRAVLLTGSLGLGHDMLARGCASLLERHGWQTRCLNSMSLLGRRFGLAGERVFGRMVAVPGLYDGLHFAHLRAGSRVAGQLDHWASTRVVPALRAELAREPADLVLSVFATGAAAAARLKAEMPERRTVVLCPDVAAHRLWVTEGTDLFLVTSAAAAASVRRFLPRARVAIIPAPVRSEFYDAPSQQQARAALGVPAEAQCALMIDSGWGFGNAAESVARLAAVGVHVLAVAGRQQRLETRFRSLAVGSHQVHPFGFSDRVPELMAAADVVIALPGASTCAEARVVGRPLLLLDVMPGHGRDNLLHELELGGAEVCGATPTAVTAATLALLERVSRPAASSRDSTARWEPAFEAACRQIGLALGRRELAEAGSR
jgi:UDP-N-acetylglucosamine:LPS N-acetylglucosamine transferase